MQTKHFTNPYYGDYNILIDLSKQLLNQQGADFADASPTSAFLFDISMLFEYYIRKLLKRKGFVLRDKQKGVARIATGAFGTYRRKLEPDLVWEDAGGLCVFDVKYKRFDPTYGVSREDLFQLHTYIGQWGNKGDIKGCGLVYPMPEGRWNKLKLDENKGLISGAIRQQGKTIPFHVIFLKIPADDNFSRQMREQGRMFVDVLKEYCG